MVSKNFNSLLKSKIAWSLQMFCLFRISFIFFLKWSSPFHPEPSGKVSKANSSRAYVTMRMHLHCPPGSLSRRVTSVSENSWAPYASGGFQELLAYTQWLIYATILPEFLGNSTKTPGYRKIRTEKVAQRDKKAVTNLRPLCALTDVQHFIRFAIMGNPFLKNNLLIWLGTKSQKELFHPQQQCLISTWIYLWQTCQDGFPYSFTHAHTHSLNIYCKKRAQWGTTERDKGQKGTVSTLN